MDKKRNQKGMGKETKKGFDFSVVGNRPSRFPQSSVCGTGNLAWPLQSYEAPQVDRDYQSLQGE